MAHSALLRSTSLIIALACVGWAGTTYAKPAKRKPAAGAGTRAGKKPKKLEQVPAPPVSAPAEPAAPAAEPPAAPPPSVTEPAPSVANARTDEGETASKAESK